MDDYDIRHPRRQGSRAVAAFAAALLIDFLGATKSHGQITTATYPGNGHFFQFINERKGEGVTWEQAARDASERVYEGIHGHLAVIHDADENEILAVGMLTSSATESWVGGYRDRQAPDFRELEAGWRWVTGERLNYTRWDRRDSDSAPANPGNKDYMALGKDGRWRATNGTRDTYIVEFDLPAKVTLQQSPPALYARCPTDAYRPAQITYLHELSGVDHHTPARCAGNRAKPVAR